MSNASLECCLNADFLCDFAVPLSVSYPDANPLLPVPANDAFERFGAPNVFVLNEMLFVVVGNLFDSPVVAVLLNSLDTVDTLGGGAFFNTGFVPRSKLPLKLPPYRPPCRNVAHLLTFDTFANVDSRIAFGPMLTYFGSKRLNPFSDTSRESGSISIELVDTLDFALVSVLNFLSFLFCALPAVEQADESQ